MTINPYTSKSRLDPEPITRRDFLGLSALISSFAALLFAAVGILRLPKAAVLSSPSKKFKVVIPDSLPPTEGFIPQGRSVVIFRDDEGVYGISLICTHLGCIVKPLPEGFECPCHGSRFALNGSVVKGPAPKSLAWIKIMKNSDHYIVDEDETVPPGTKVIS